MLLNGDLVVFQVLPEAERRIREAIVASEQAGVSRYTGEILRSRFSPVAMLTLTTESGETAKLIEKVPS